MVEHLEAGKAFLIELGLRLEGEATVEGPMVGNLIGLEDVKATLAMLRTPDGNAGIELDKFHTPQPVRYGPVDTPVNALGYRRVMFSVEGMDGILARMRAFGATLIGEIRYEDAYQLPYTSGGPEDLIVGLAEETRKPAPPRAKKAARPQAARGKPVRRATPAGRGKASRKPGEARKKRKS